MDNNLRKFAKSLPLVRKSVQRYRYRGIQDKDAMLASYPKSGNTWAKLLIAQLLTERVPDFDYAESIIPLLSDYQQAPHILPQSGRLLKTHAPFSQLYPWHFGRAIYLVRDGRDVAVSYYYHNLRSGRFQGSFSEFLVGFLQGDRYDTYGPWHEHVNSWLSSPMNLSNQVLILHYEAMLNETLKSLTRIAEFLQLEVDQPRLIAAIDANTADSMRSREKDWKGIDRRGQRKHAIPFVRSAKAGDWMSHFSKDDASKFMKVAGTTLTQLGYE